MEWRDLTTTSKNVLEQCWEFRNDNPRSVSISIGEKFKVHDNEYVFTEDNYKEIIEYLENTKYISVKRSGDYIVYTGIGQFGSWLSEELE